MILSPNKDQLRLNSVLSGAYLDFFWGEGVRPGVVLGSTHVRRHRGRVSVDLVSVIMSA